MQRKKKDVDILDEYTNDHHDYYDDGDTDKVIVDLGSREPMTKEEKDGCFDFFDLILDTGEGNKRRNNILDVDDRSHISEISF